MYALLICAVGATVKVSVSLYPVPNYLTAAVRTLRRHGLNCALKAIKNMRFARCSNLKCPVILVATGFTACHCYFLLLLSQIKWLSENNYASDVPKDPPELVRPDDSMSHKIIALREDMNRATQNGETRDRS